MRKIILGKEFLYNEYVVEHKTIEKISVELKIDKRIIKRNLVENGINKKLIFIEKINKKELEELYLDKKFSQRKIAEMFGVSSGTVRLALVYFKISARDKSWKNSETKSGKFVPCAICGKVVYRKKSRLKRQNMVFCSNNCSHEYQSIVMTKVSEKIGWRRRKLYRQWRKSVFSRDNSRCKLCGSEKKICAHHILEVQDYPKEKYNIENGITLCQKCHIFIHKNDSHTFIESLKKAIS
jgi:5-methylcytosine-specific restriction endonuclease McrA